MRRPGMRRRWVVVASAVLLALAACGSSDGTVRAIGPISVVGDTAAVARTRLVAAGVPDASIEVQAREVSGDDVGKVLEQAVGTGAEAGTYTLVVGARKVVGVPDVAAKTEAAATESLSKAGFVVKVVSRRADAKVAKGVVIRQDPAAGTKQSAGATVKLAVSTGPPTVKVPAIIGLQEAQAEARLKEVGLRYTREQRASNLVAGTIVDADPRPGTVLVKGKSVTLFISPGPPPTTSPPATRAPTTEPRTPTTHRQTTQPPQPPDTPPTTHCEEVYVDPVYSNGQLVTPGHTELRCS